MVILYSAPFPPENSGNHGSPGAMRKIGLTIRLLKHLGHSVILIDSSHLSNADSIFCATSVSERFIGKDKFKVLTPTTIWNRKLGKTIQALRAPSYGRFAGTISTIDLVLIYNTYVFEVRLAKALLRQLGIPFVLQLEDLPWSRRRGFFNVKANIERAMFNDTCRDASLILAVNSSILSLVQGYNDNVELYPPIIDPKLEKLAQKRRAPFSGERIKIGYFGGLNKEKGADKLLELAFSLKSPCVVHIAGKGDLTSKFKYFAENHPNKLVYHGFVSEEQLNSLLCDMDILINPHTDLREFDEGIFPFKLFEFIASGAYVITTSLLGAEATKLDGLVYFDGSGEELLERVTNAPVLINQGTQRRIQTSAASIAGFGQVTQRVGDAIKNIRFKP